ncbi:Uma2 family endonuclease [Trichodesmium erythraeum 21-75]|nr:Uma2 family endonuclease [Trichodesmium erythraeum 21-75]
MGLSDIVSSEVSVSLIADFYAWVNPGSLGNLFNSSSAFIFPDTNIKAPDVSFVSAQNLKKAFFILGNWCQI